MVLAVLLLILILPVGVDVSYQEQTTFLKVKIGPLRIQILPKKAGEAKKQKSKPASEARQDTAQKRKQKPGPADFLEIARLILKTASRFRKCLSIDRFVLHLVCASEDPYGTVMLFGYLNAGLSALSPLLHRALKIRSEDIRIAADLELGRPLVEARLTASLQIWEILYIGFCAGFGFLRWFLPYRRAGREQEKTAAAARPVEQKG